MGYELLVAFFVTVLAPLVLLGFVAFWVFHHRERAEIERAWERFAAAREREYVPARGEWPNRTSPAVVWTAADVGFELQAIGPESGARTRLVARPRAKLLGRFTIERAPGRRRSGLGDPAFDAKFAVSDDADLASSVLGVAGRRRVLAFCQGDAIALRYARGRLVLEWPGREPNDARLDEAERLLAELARNVDAVFLDRARRAPG